ncbi:MAG: TetR/AcrR family transcriptional regulator C-terminal domain-containing protein [Candidatus Limivivens sp.]|nr:TetR/AcrR family transcriptional regulator C-terminal domain-containing protein [Candidatus Limivivens sp.]
MPDSNITKKALANALKELMASVPFRTISISDICGKCDMSRKSFYYHFRDKYELVNWIYYNEFISVARDKDYGNEWEFLMDICSYFYKNRAFYQKALKIEGQNSFSEYFRELLLPIIEEYMTDVFQEEENWNFYVQFYADAISVSIERWIQEKECMPPEKFVSLMRSCVWRTAEKMVEEIPKNEKRKENEIQKVIENNTEK